MNFKKFLGAFKNTSKITEGIKNNIFKKDHVEAEAALRWAICKQCLYLDKSGDSCAVTGTQPCCSDCGCSLTFKTRSLSSECTQGKWPALMTEEEEDLLNEQIEKNNDKH